MSGGIASAFVKTLDKLVAEFEQFESRLEEARKLILKTDSRMALNISNLSRTISRQIDTLQNQGRGVIKQLEQYQSLAETTALLNSTLELNTVLNHVMDNIIRLTGAERAYIVLRESGNLRVAAARNWEDNNAAEQEVMFSTSIIDTTLRDGQPVLTVSALDDQRFQEEPSVMALALRSVLCVPLSSRGEIIGVVYMDNRSKPGIFDEDTVELVKVFANQSAIAIQNARQFQKVNADLQEAQRKLADMSIEIDESEVQTRVENIAESKYFQMLQSRLGELRGKHRGNS